MNNLTIGFGAFLFLCFIVCILTSSFSGGAHLTTDKDLFN